MPQISIIIPIYKVEAYLPRCVDSILAQTFTDFELILVDDGSPDNCGKICDEYARKDKRICVIHKENGGVSSARNVGLNHAQGDYIMFVDSDDWIAPDYCEKMYHDIAETDSDIVCSNLTTISENGKVEPSSLIHIPDNYVAETRNDILAEAFSLRVVGVVWAKLYKRSVINGLRFDESIKYGEDTKFFREAISNSQKVCLRTYTGYFYFLHSASACRSVSNPLVIRFDKIRVSIDSVELFCKEDPCIMQKAVEELYRNIIGAYTDAVSMACGCEERLKIKPYAEFAFEYKYDVKKTLYIRLLLFYYCFPIAKTLRKAYKSFLNRKRDSV